ncbi:MAG: DUF4445 domain-containing protein [Anaerolineae bacterium]|nr:DUF4445 domain-containing protein [Anaerolineae bacterium]
MEVRHGSLLSEAIQQAGLDLNIPCGGQGRCGRCAVIVPEGSVRARVATRLSAQDIAAGYVLACQAVVEGDCTIIIPPQEQIVRRLTSERTAARIGLPFPYNPELDQTVRGFFVRLPPPTLGDQMDDWSRLRTALAQEHQVTNLTADLVTLRRLGAVLRKSGEQDWPVTAIVEMDAWDRSYGPPRLIDVLPGERTEAVWGTAIDIGTTTVTVYLVNLVSGEVAEVAADYNGQIRRGEDVISRIVYAAKSAANNNGSKPSGLAELQNLVLETIGRLLARCCQRRDIEPTQIYKATIAGNPTMIHLLAGVPPEQIRLAPYVPAVNDMPTLRAAEIGLGIHPAATVDCLPGVASYVGADITAGLLSTGFEESDDLSLFIDVGTNGETVLGTREWMLSCACSAGPAFEGAGVEHGMRATAGAIEEVWINSQTWEPTYRVIGNEMPRGICGSGLIGLLAELFITGVIDRAGSFRHDLPTPRVRQGEHGGEYVVAWAAETATGRDVVLTKVDIDNLLRAKAAIYAGFSVLAHSLDLRLEDVSRFLIGGNFGQHVNVEKAVQIGLLPDFPWDRFHFLGNTAIRGAYMALLSRDARSRLTEIARRVTYLELSADNAFYNEFTSALFLPHTDQTRFPSVASILKQKPEMAWEDTEQNPL